MRISRLVLTMVISVVLAAVGGAALAAAGERVSANEDFLALCADCHGADARGNGPLTKNLTKIPPDLTRIEQRDHGKFDEKAVFDWILGINTPNFHGTREMPIWGDWLMDETLEDGTSLEAAHAAEKEINRRVQALVKYLKALQVKD
jgi:mono/diheme cytochrome c family protein